jgi:hypothetical protein
MQEYDANPEDYGTDDPQTMADIDRDNLQGDISDIISFIDGSEVITVEVVS